jgi:hypothetical protein
MKNMCDDISLYSVVGLVRCYNERMIIVDVPIVCVMSLSLCRRQGCAALKVRDGAHHSTF